MKNILIIIAFSFPTWTLAQSGAVPSPESAAALTQALHFTDSIFSRPSFTYDLSEPDFPPDLQSILIRFNNAIAANKEWFLDYRSKNSTPLPYNERFGITPAEYQRIQNLEKLPPHFSTISQQQITVTHDNGHIRFKGIDETRILDYLDINLTQRQLLFAGDTLNFVGPMNASQLLPLGLSKGYTWRLEKADIKSTLEAGKVTARVVEINLGTPLPSNSNPNTPLLRIKYQDMLQGTIRADFDFMGFIH